ncbi:MAG: PEP-CTERM sorting domain-containing protein [Fimbriimonadaceae bacterium]
MSRLTVAGGLLMAASASFATITFSNIVVTLPAGFTQSAVFTGTSDIDFHFADAMAGDFQAVRSGTITISYQAAAAPGFEITGMNLSVLGGALGSGIVGIDEEIRSGSPFGPLLGSFSAVAPADGDLPINHYMEFDGSATTIFVTKNIRVDATADTNDFDFAAVGLVEQSYTVVPEPATMAAVTLGFGMLAARRRRR